MHNKSKFSLQTRLRSFKYAINGLKLFYKNEPHAWVHSILTLIVILFGFIFQINSTEWMIILICIGAVFSAEFINSAIEKLSDHVEPNIHPNIKAVKDTAAGAVLFMAIISAIIALIIFTPKIIQCCLTLNLET